MANLSKSEREALLEKIAAQALGLICEIEKRDGEGNTIPAYLYRGLLMNLCDAALANVKVGHGRAEVR